ncbi:flagellar motor switch protein FliN [Aliifodinibius salicampi]|uniref:Flagellar motor switch protein FliN n=1 Tax=Fodinibius salicampi TaxID=1920655 RepID=A0ABT3Q0G7_9BACT|nr:flagellar motor switch protein FliN [Fodinibius salicampi]MCW9713610.1 flagellar motor switch protein FliN [Fodinibius salicampi]
MENVKEEFKQYLPAIEEFLTSVLLEETHIEIANSDSPENESALEHLKETDIVLYARDQVHDADVIIVLDPEWYGLLSSIMLGIEEKEKNDTTIELLEEFSDDLSDVVFKKLKENEIEPELTKVQVLSKSEMQEQLAHSEYFWINLEIEGLADNKVRAEFLLGDPATKIEPEETDEVQDVDEQTDTTSERISPIVETEKDSLESGKEKGAPKEARQEQVISARHIEFAEFSEEDEQENGETHSMDLLKDVELDVSVELGRIELPLGKVLQLAKGSVVELEKLAGEPVDILVNGNRIALGEVVVIDEHFGVRISSLVTTKKRLAKISNGS